MLLNCPENERQKFEILKEFDKNSGLMKVELSKKIDVSVSILKTINYERKKIEDRTTACGNSASKKLCI